MLRSGGTVWVTCCCLVAYQTAADGFITAKKLPFIKAALEVQFCVFKGDSVRLEDLTFDQLEGTGSRCTPFQTLASETATSTIKKLGKKKARFVVAKVLNTKKRDVFGAGVIVVPKGKTRVEYSVGLKVLGYVNSSKKKGKYTATLNADFEVLHESNILQRLVLPGVVVRGKAMKKRDKSEDSTDSGSSSSDSADDSHSSGGGPAVGIVFFLLVLLIAGGLVYFFFFREHDEEAAAGEPIQMQTHLANAPRNEMQTQGEVWAVPVPMGPAPPPLATPAWY